MVVVKCQSCDWERTTIPGHAELAASTHRGKEHMLDTSTSFEVVAL